MEWIVQEEVVQQHFHSQSTRDVFTSTSDPFEDGSMEIPACPCTHGDMCVSVNK